jgi:hypothetical protein
MRRSLSARDGADIAADAVRQIGKRVQLDDLAGELLDGADAVGKIVARMSRLADHIEAHEFAALASGDDAAGRAAGLAVEHRACRPRRLLDQRLGRRRADLLIGGEQGRDSLSGILQMTLERREDSTPSPTRAWNKKPSRFL